MRINNIEDLKNWFNQIDYTRLSELSSWQLATQILSRLLFDRFYITENLYHPDQHKNKYEVPPFDKPEHFLDWDDVNGKDYSHNNLNDFILYEEEVFKVLKMENNWLTRSHRNNVHFFTQLGLGNLISNQIDLNETPLNNQRLNDYINELIEYPVKPYSLGLDLLFKREFDFTKKNDPELFNETDKVYPKLNEYGAFDLGQHMTLKSHRNENPLSGMMTAMLTMPTDTLLTKNFTNKNEHRINVDFNYSDDILIQNFKHFIKKYRKEYIKNDPKKLTENLIHKIIDYKTIQIIDIEIMASANKLNVSAIEIARIANNDNDIDSNRFNQNIKPFVNKVKEGEFNLALVTNDSKTLLKYFESNS